MDYLKSKPVEITSIGQTLVIKQLSVAGWHAFRMVFNDSANEHLAMAMICKHGVPEWHDKEAAEIAEMLTPESMKEISDAIQDLGGIPKNLESTPIDGSSSN